MPCRDYESDTGSSISLNKALVQNDRLARIACKAMDALVKSGQADFLLLADDEVRDWYAAHQEADRKAKEAREERLRVAAIKSAALSKLSAEEKKILGIKVR